MFLSREKIKNPKISTFTTEKTPTLRETISLKFHSKMLPRQKSLTLATAAVRLGRPLAKNP